MCPRSNNPQPVRTAWCSAVIPPNWTGMSQPAKSTKRPPAAFWTAYSAVRAVTAIPFAHCQEGASPLRRKPNDGPTLAFGKTPLEKL